MGISIKILADFKMLFTGNIKAYGIHEYIYDKTKKKEQGKNFTKVEVVLEKLYINHLEGQKGLGIIPIDNHNMCHFAAIDIDIYDHTIDPYIDIIYRFNIPVLPFRTKSGGLHLYMFFKIPIKANKVRHYMDSIKTLLGLNHKVEIFPKQASLVDGQIGNWINLPYFNAKDTKQYLYRQNKDKYSIEEAVLEIKKRQQTEESLLAFFENVPLKDAPPCLQTIYLFSETDSRNEYLFSLAGYFKTKYGDDFEFKIMEANNQLRKPLSQSEISKTIIPAHKKKDYSYKCNGEPLISLCHKGICKSRRYGIGGEEINQLSYEDFIQYNTEPPYYEWIVNGQSLKFYNEVDIIHQQRFRVLCFRLLHLLPNRLKEINWTKIINRALENVIIKDINDEDDISPGALFKEHLTDFLEKSTLAKTKEQILVNRVYKDKEIISYVFKPKNFISFLINQKQFRFYGTTEIQNKLRELGAEPKRYFINAQRKNIRVWLLPFSSLHKFIKDEEEIGPIEIDFKEEYEDEPF